jgi:hypothetical protein
MRRRLSAAPERNILGIAVAVPADAAHGSHALIARDEAAIRAVSVAGAVIGAPWIVLRLGVCTHRSPNSGRTNQNLHDHHRNYGVEQ